MNVQSRDLDKRVLWDSMPKLGLYLFLYSCIIRHFQVLLIFPELAILYGACFSTVCRYLFLLVIWNFIFNLATCSFTYGPTSYNTPSNSCKILLHMSFIVRLLAIFVFILWAIWTYYSIYSLNRYIKLQHISE